MTTRQLSGLYDRLLDYKVFLVLGLTLLSLFVLLPGYPVQGPLAPILIALPVIAVAGLFGLKYGFISWVLAFMVSLLMHAATVEGVWEFFQFRVGVLALMLVSVLAVGQLYDHRRNSNVRYNPQPQAQSPPFSQQFADHLPEMVYIYDLEEGRTTYVNPAAARLLGYPLEAVSQLSEALFPGLVHPDDWKTLQQGLPGRVAALKSGQSVTVTFRLKSASGEWRWLQSREGFYDGDESGSPLQVIGVAHEMSTVGHDIQSALEYGKREGAVEKERELSQLKTRLMETISHEFRTPLSVILASGELLERYFDRMTPARRAECVASIKTQVLHLREMLDDVTALTGSENFKPIFRPSPTNLESLFRAVVAEMQSSVSTAYNLVFTSDGDLKAVMADEELLRPILRNLLGNAIKYSPIGGTVYLHLSRRDHEFVFTVRDNGLGIPQDDQSQIFDTFHRARNTSHIGGLGLGLKIVREFVTLQGGTVEFESVEGQGTTFTVRLPVADT